MCVCASTLLRVRLLSGMWWLQAHAECAEGFYRKEIETDVRTEPSKTAEERRRTLELLKRFEEDALDDPLAELDAEDGDEGADLAGRLGGLDIGRCLPRDFVSLIKDFTWLWHLRECVV